MSKGNIPSYLEDDVQERIAARGSETTFLVDESVEEVIVSYTKFSDALEREYDNTRQERDESALKVYHLSKESGAVQLSRYDGPNGVNGEVVWRDRLG